MKNLKHILFFLISFSVSLVYAQTSEIDSLQNILQNSKGKQKVDVLTQLCLHLSGSDNQKAIDYGQQAVDLAIKINYKKGIGYAKFYLSCAKYFNSEFLESKKLSEEAYNMHTEMQDTTFTGNTLVMLGVIADSFGDHDEALEIYLEALDLFKAINNTDGISACYTNIGLIYQRQNDYVKFLEFEKKSLELDKKLGNKENMAKSYVNIAIVYNEMQDYHSAVKILETAIELFKETNYEQGLSSAYNNLAQNYFKIKDFEKAVDYYTLSLKLKQKFNLQSGIGNTLINLGEVYLEMKRYKLASEYFFKAKKIADSNEFPELTRDVYHNLYCFNNKTGKYKRALFYYKKYVAVKDSIEKAVTNNKIIKYQSLFESKQKEEEITNLNLEKKLQKSVIKRQRITTIAVIVSLILFIFLSIFAYRGYILKKKASNLLSEQNKRIEEQKHEIISQNNKLEDQTKSLKELDRVKSNFFANISHEFRTPLTLIAGPVEQLIQKNIYPEIETDLEVVYRHSKRLKQLINQLLDISKIEKGAMKLQVSKDDLKPFTRTLVNSFHSFAEENKIDLQFESEENELFCLFDKDKIEKIIGNLITNAVKFTTPGGKVVVRLKIKDKKANIEVEDTGKGISKDNQKLIFERFFRSEEHNSIGGTGIGLSLVNIADYRPFG